ncbi:hypothetical protein BGW42_003713 [Actinomortierella wolfii]|nr:hypothetical protein BGW42_003713 [Actinomortierella wolfii]
MDYSAPPPSYDSIDAPQNRPSGTGGSYSYSPYAPSSSSSSATASYIAATTTTTSSTSSAFTATGYPNEKAQAYRSNEPEIDIRECIQTLETIAADSARASQTTPASQLSPNSIMTSLGYEPSEGSWYEVIQQFEHVVGICYDYHVLGYGTLSITQPGLVWEGNLIQPKHSFGDFLEQDFKTFRFRFPSKSKSGGSGGDFSTTLSSSSLLSMGSPFSSRINSSLSSVLKPARPRRVQSATIKQVMPVVQSGAVALARVDKAFKSRLEWGGGGVLDESEYDYPGVMLITTVIEDAVADDPDAIASFQFVFERAKLADLEKAAKDVREYLPSSSSLMEAGAAPAPSAPPLPSYDEIHPLYPADTNYV